MPSAPKRKVLVYLGLDMYYRNYLQVGAFDLPGSEVVIYGEPATQHRYLYTADPARYRGVFGFPKDPKKAKALGLLQTLLIVKYRDRSKSFKFRIQQMQTKAQKLFAWLCHSELMFKALERYFHGVLGDSKEIEEVLVREKPDVVLAPSTTDVPAHYYLIKACRKLKVPIVLLVDGWDNISSKTVFPVQPDYIGVWGKQSEDQAVSIHDYPRDRIFRIGTPRFDPYFKEADRPKELPFKERYALFTGCNLPFDEISTLKYLDWWIEENKIRDFKILYRPHPWMQKRQSFNVFIDYKHIVLDPQMREYYWLNQFKPETKSYLFPALEYYPGLLKNCEFMISSLTTMIMEGALVDKPVLVLAYDDGVHFANPRRALENYAHFENIDKIDAFKFCFEFSELGRVMGGLLEQTSRAGVSSPGALRKGLDTILEPSAEAYRDRLERVLSQVLKTS